jgi:hypothetical protein
MELDQSSPCISTGLVASADWKTRIVALDQSHWQTCGRRDADPVTTLSLGRGQEAVANDRAARVPIAGAPAFI